MVLYYTVLLSRFQPGIVKRQQVYRTLLQLHTVPSGQEMTVSHQLFFQQLDTTVLPLIFVCNVFPSLFSQGTEPGLNPSQVTINISHMHMHFSVSVQCLNPSQSTSRNCKQNDSAMIFFPHCCSSVCLSDSRCL